MPGRQQNILCQRPCIQRDFRADALHLSDMVAVIVCEQHGIAAPIFIRYPRNSQGCRNKVRIEGQFIAHVDKNARCLRGNFSGNPANLMRTSVNTNFQSHSPSQTSPNKMEVPWNSFHPLIVRSYSIHSPVACSAEIYRCTLRMGSSTSSASSCVVTPG